MVKEIALLITFQVRRIDTESIEVCVAVHDTAVVVVANKERCPAWLLAVYSFTGKTMESDYDYLFKIVLIGDAGVGKTSIVRRYCDGVFTSAGIPTIGVDFCIKTIKIGNDSIKVVMFEIFDVILFI